MLDGERQVRRWGGGVGGRWNVISHLTTSSPICCILSHVKIYPRLFFKFAPKGLKFLIWDKQKTEKLSH